MPLLRWTAEESFTLEDACKGLQIWGMTGSGKSSASGHLVALSYLRSGFGGLVLCAKPDEAETWRKYCQQTGRADQLVVFSPSSPWRFNFLDYELSRPGAGAGLTENILRLFMTVAEIAGRGTGGGEGREDEGYWKRSLQQLLRNTIDLLVIATGRVSVPDLYRLVVSAPTSFDQTGSETWQTRSFCWQCLQHGDTASKRGYQAHDFQLVADYFLLEYPGLSEKTRSVIVSTFTSMIDVLNRGVLRELFCTTTNVTPEDCLDGKIVVIDLPVKEFAEVGQFAAVLWKYLFQRAVERRDVRGDPRPVFLFVDESQLFTTAFDALFQTTARSARCCTVFLTQNLNNYLTAYKGPSGPAEAKSLLGNLTTHVVHALADSDTAQFVAELIGRRRQLFMNGSASHESPHPIDDLFGRRSGQQSGGFSESFEYDLQPSELFRMKTGGIANNFQVQGLVWRGGRPFPSTCRSYLWTIFDQRRT
ncbi:type IV secretory system conjugative DNA transfer family protein [Frigoriglobus tundricola]|nr:TraM recognition domain-containing protein [Frigoriglobus tundricola]